MLFCFFPFISFIETGTDVQPYGFMISIILIAVFGNSKMIPKAIIPLFFVAFFAFFMFLLGEISFGSARGLYSYLSLFSVSFATYLMLKKYNGIPERLIKIIINLWFIVGFIQTFIKPDFLLFLVANDGRTSLTRGVPNLTAEPSFYGYMLIFALLFVLDFKSKKKFYLINLIIQLFFFAQSSVGILYLIVYIVIYSIVNISSLKSKTFINIAIFAIVFYLLTSALFQLMPNARVSFIFQSILNDPFDLIYKDASINNRFNSIVEPIALNAKHFFKPQGFSSAKNHFNTYRIGSGYSSAIWELGIIGIFLICSLTKIVMSAKYHENKIIHGIFLLVIMFSSIQLSVPIFGFYIGYSIYKKMNNNCYHY